MELPRKVMIILYKKIYFFFNYSFTLFLIFNGKRIVLRKSNKYIFIYLNDIMAIFYFLEKKAMRIKITETVISLKVKYNNYS